MFSENSNLTQILDLGIFIAVVYTNARSIYNQRFWKINLLTSGTYLFIHKIISDDYIYIYFYMYIRLCLSLN